MATALSIFEGNTDLALNDDMKNELAACEGLAGGGGSYLPYIRLMQATSQEVNDEKAVRCDYVCKVNNEVVNLGKEFDCAVISVRPKAVEWRDGVPIICYDRKCGENNQSTGEYARIEQAEKDWEGPKRDNPFKTGPEFLLAVNNEYAPFVTLHLNSPSLKYNYRDIASYLTKHATISGVKTEYKNNTFATLAIRPNSAGFPIDMEALQEVRTKFKEEKGTDTSALPDEDEDNGRD